MELTSQKLRKIAPELDPLRLGTGWKLEDLSKPQIMIESTFGDSHPEADIFWIWSKRQDRVLQRQVVSELVISVRISVMEKHRDMMESTIHCRPEI